MVIKDFSGAETRLGQLYKKAANQISTGQAPR
jgi:hypothetical protein